MNIKDLKTGFDNLLVANTVIKRQKQTKETIKKKEFCFIINNYELFLQKENILNNDFGIDLSELHEPMYKSFDTLLKLAWGPEIYRILEYYLYNRVDDNGNIGVLVLENGSQVVIPTSDKLYDFINHLHPNKI